MSSAKPGEVALSESKPSKLPVSASVQRRERKEYLLRIYPRLAYLEFVAIRDCLPLTSHPKFVS